MSKLEILNIVPGDDNGFMTYTITATPVRNSGDDEISMVLAAA